MNQIDPSTALEQFAGEMVLAANAGRTEGEFLQGARSRPLGYERRDRYVPSARMRIGSGLTG